MRDAPLMSAAWAPEMIAGNTNNASAERMLLSSLAGAAGS
jgi:hypothetical protein